MFRPLGSASYDVIYEAGATICYRHWVLRLLISFTRQGVYDLLRALGSASCDISHDTEDTTCFDHWVLCLVISSTRQEEPGGIICYRCWFLFVMILRTARDRGDDLLCALGSAPCDIPYNIEDTICFGHWVLCLVLSHTRQGVLRALGSALYDMPHEIGATSSYGH